MNHPGFDEHGAMLPARLAIGAATLLAASLSQCLFAQAANPEAETDGQAATHSDAAQAQNPIAHVISVPLRNIR